MPLELTDILSGRGFGDDSPPAGARRPAEGAADEARPSLPVAALTMELQRGVMGDVATFPQLADAAGARHTVANAARLLAAFRAHRLAVVHCTAEFSSDRAGTVVNTPLHSAVLRRPEHLLEHTVATELVPDLGAEPSDLVSTRRHGVAPFTGTDLHGLLSELGVRVVVVTGVSTNLGVLGLCVEAVNLGYQVVVASDAVVGVPLDYADMVLEHSVSLVATVRTVDEIIGALDQVHRVPPSTTADRGA